MHALSSCDRASVAAGGICTASRCCQTPDFTCYSKNPSFARCLTRCPDPGQAQADASDWACTIHDKTKKALPPPPPTPSPPPPRPQMGSFHPSPPPPAPAFCAANRAECAASRCCQSSGYVCYEKGPHHAECLPAGQCRTRWPDEAEATCSVLRAVTTCAAFAGDCTHSGCCAAEGQHCFMKDPFFSRCMHACVPTDSLRGWSCVVHERDEQSEPAAFCTSP